MTVFIRIFTPKVRSDHHNNGLFVICLTLWRRPNHCGQSSVLQSKTFVTGTASSPPGMRQGWKCGVQGDEEIDLTVGDHFAH